MRATYLRYIGAFAALLLASGAQAALVSVAGGQAVYDNDLDVTWASNANLAATNTFGLTTNVDLGLYPSDNSGVNGRILPNGAMNWPGTLFWIDAMNASNYLGVNDWRLPVTLYPDSTCDTQPSGSFNCTGSEMGHLYNVEGATAAMPGPFSNVVDLWGWSGSEYSPLDPDNFAWFFKFSNGSQSGAGKANFLFGWAVRSGDISLVPVPAAVWLFGSALGLLGWLRRRA